MPTPDYHFTDAQIAVLEYRGIAVEGVSRRRIWLRTDYPTATCRVASAAGYFDSRPVCPVIDAREERVLIVLPDGLEHWCELERVSDAET